jgi:hypothetical protein
VNLRGNPADGLGAWSVRRHRRDLAQRTQRHARSGRRAMNDAIVHSTQYLSDADLNAIAAYLKTLAPTANSPSSFHADSGTANALRDGIHRREAPSCTPTTAPVAIAATAWAMRRSSRPSPAIRPCSRATRVR